MYIQTLKIKGYRIFNEEFCVTLTKGLVTNESYKNSSGERVTDSQWHYLTARGKTADYIEKSITIGCEIAIEGKLCTRTFVDSSNIKQHKAEIHIREILVLEANRQNQSG